MVLTANGADEPANDFGLKVSDFGFKFAESYLYPGVEFTEACFYLGVLLTEACCHLGS